MLRRSRRRARQARVRPVAPASILSVMMLQAVPVKAQPFFVFQPFAPYVTGETRLTLDRELFDTRGDRTQGGQSLETAVNGRYGGRGYLWRPWFSDLSADLDLNLTHLAAGGSATSDEDIRWDGSASAELNLVPRSHIPFSAGFLYSRDDRESELLRLRLDQEIQTFSPVAPDYSFNYQFENRRRRGSENARHNLLSRMAGDYQRHVYSTQLSVLQLNNSSTSSDSETLTFDLTADHRYDWRDDLIVSEYFSAFDSATDNDGSDIWAGGAQANVVATWSPLGSWSGNALLSARHNETEVVGGPEVQRSRITEYSGSGAVTYRPTDYFRTSLALTVTRVERLVGEATDESSQTLNAFYNPAVIGLGVFIYRWDAGTSFRASQRNAGKTEDANVSLGHTLSRRWGGYESEWTFDANQDVDYRYLVAGESAEAVDVSQRVSLTWRGQSESYRDYAQLSFSDRREFFGEEGEAQSIDLALNRQGDLGRFSRWEVDVNYQIFREVTDEGASTVDDEASSRGRLNLAYTRANVWGVYNLFFRSELDAQLDYEKDDDAVMRDSSWENALEYRLGRLSSELSIEITEADDGATGALFFEVRRRWDSR